MNLKVSQSITLVGLVPLFVILILTFCLGKVLFQEAMHGQRSSDVVNLTDRLELLTHNIAVERGISAGYLASDGLRGLEALTNQRQKNDDLIKSLKSLSEDDFQKLSQSEINELISPILSKLKQINSVRKEVDSLSSSSNAFQYFSDINSDLLHAFQKIAATVDSHKLINALTAKESLLWMKERVGQYRGALNAAFNSGMVNESKLISINNYIVNESMWLNFFNGVAKPEYQELLNDAKLKQEWQSVQSVLENFKTFNSYSTVEGPHDWFELATGKILLIKSVSDAITKDAHLQVDGLAKERILIFEAFLFAIFITVVCVAGFIWYTTKGISRRVALINKAFMQVSQNKDFGVKVDIQSKDELGEIAQSMGTHFSEVSNIFATLKNKTVHLDENLKLMIQEAQKSFGEAQIQSSKTEQIAVAVEQMSMTSHTIASDMVAVSESTGIMQVQATDGKKGIALIQSAIEALKSEVYQGYQCVEQVSGQSEKIASILETIESIAEQTNLLALNAAIEAARAGEQGRGFAVVADEVRSLAQLTQGSTEEIRSMIEGLVSSSKSAMRSMDNCSSMVNHTNDEVAKNSEMIEVMMHSVDEINSAIERVAASAEEQSQVSDTINFDVQSVRDRSCEILTAAGKTEVQAEESSKLFHDVSAQINVYKLA